jgi:predicted polyphosphate/ATP-dependent NAD kinase
MPTVGIIANPASGKDIRRLVARSSVFDNNEKVNILRRILLALEAMGVQRAVFMPDYYGLGEHAIEDLNVALDVSFLPMEVHADERDSTEAARRFREMEVGCIITLGGDGTNRAVAKESGTVPLVPISTGTNNVVPYLVEGTVAGLAAGLLATGAVDPEKVSRVAKRLEIYRDGALLDIALVDVAVSSDLFIASRALWDPSRIREIVLARATSDSVGMSAIGSRIQVIGPDDELGMHLRMGADGTQVLAPVAPGLVTPVGIRDCRMLSLGDEVTLKALPSTVALDGERSLKGFPDQPLRVRLTRNGPRIVDIEACMAEGIRQGAFRRERVAGAPFGTTWAGGKGETQGRA